ncbi:MAG TPA: DUF4139 domain-containing protein [Candidatus Binatia bacterium]|nr:DUF4139 domain-containing protein [Candidatus Binatia bacterium]
MQRIRFITVALLLFAIPLQIIADPPERTTTTADRQSINLTVYNGGTALIHDRRTLRLDDGLNRIAWRDVSAQMDPTSALVDGGGSANAIRVVEQNFNFDLLDPSALLDKYVGQEVTVVHEARFAGERDARERARILSTNGGIVLQYRDRIETQLRGYIIFPASPKNFRDRPTLDLDLDSGESGTTALDLSYLTSGLSWRADYVGVVSSDQRHLSLTGLVTLSNTSGASYENARLQLVAGNVNVVGPPSLYAMKTIARVTSNVQQENYFEYHLYTLARPTSILDKQTKQLTLLAARGIPIHETLELRGSPEYYRNADSDIGARLPVGAYVTFENRGGDLGIPLPGGIVRLYKSDSRGLSQFMGSDQIDHTPRNETVRLHLGDSFDVTARKRQTEFRFSSACSADSSYQIVVANAKTVAQNVLVVEPIPGDWQIVDENVSHVKSSAFTATWNLRVPADSRSMLTYTARVSWCYEGTDQAR